MKNTWIYVLGNKGCQLYHYTTHRQNKDNVFRVNRGLHSVRKQLPAALLMLSMEHTLHYYTSRGLIGFLVENLKMCEYTFVIEHDLIWTNLCGLYIFEIIFFRCLLNDVPLFSP